MKTTHLIISAVLLLFLFSTSLAQKRLALVIGNSQYTGGSGQTLKNPVNDANLMAQTLQKVGFTVIKRTNCGKQSMEQAFQQFASQLASAEVALFFYAGHGMQVNGVNYLIPTDATLANETDVRWQTIKMNDLVDELERYPDKVNIIILDACRNNPYRSWARSAGSRGFKAPSPSSGTIIAFATSENETASDGTGMNGLFTQELVKQIVVPQPIESVFKRTRVEVQHLSQGQQIPQEWSKLNADFAFVLPSGERTGTLTENPVTLKKPVPSSEKPRCPSSIPRQEPESELIEMVYVQGGIFQMGSYDGDADEKPVHAVTVNSFYIGKYEVTQRQWKEIMGTNPSRFKDCDQCPIEFVSWNGIQEFLQKLYEKTGKKYRLPTEAEWEYAARGGNQIRGYKYSGSNDIGNVAWYTDNSSGKTHPVGQKQPNELGIYDTSGNVWEWCSDWYDEKYYSSSPAYNPQGSSGGTFRVLRGGSWSSYPGGCRTADRSWIGPDNRDGSFGFRVSRTE